MLLNQSHSNVNEASKGAIRIFFFFFFFSLSIFGQFKCDTIVKAARGCPLASALSGKWVPLHQAASHLLRRYRVAGSPSYLRQGKLLSMSQRTPNYQDFSGLAWMEHIATSKRHSWIVVSPAWPPFVGSIQGTRAHPSNRAETRHNWEGKGGGGIGASLDPKSENLDRWIAPMGQVTAGKKQSFLFVPI